MSCKAIADQQSIDLKHHSESVIETVLKKLSDVEASISRLNLPLKEPLPSRGVVTSEKSVLLAEDTPVPGTAPSADGVSCAKESPSAKVGAVGKIVHWKAQVASPRPQARVTKNVKTPNSGFSCHSRRRNPLRNCRKGPGRKIIGV